MKLNNTQDHSLICRTQFQQQSYFKLDPQRFLNWDLESFTTFQDAFDPFFRQLGHVLSLWLHRPPRYVFSAALRALCSLSVGRQNNGAKGKKKTPCLSLIKGGRTFFSTPSPPPPPIKHSRAYLRHSSREVVEWDARSEEHVRPPEPRRLSKCQGDVFGTARVPARVPGLIY